MVNILIVEDEQDLADAVQEILQQFQIDLQIFQASTVSRALRVIDKKELDIVILDWMLPDGEGLELIGYLNKYSALTRILMLTQKDQTKEKIKGLETGADDYLPKPFASKELLLRVKKLIYSYKLQEQEKIQVGACVLHFDSGALQTKTDYEVLPRKEAQILQVLMIHSPQILSKEQIISHVWPLIDKRPSLNTVEVYIRRLRGKLGECQDYLRTKRGFGYYFKPTAD